MKRNRKLFTLAVVFALALLSYMLRISRQTMTPAPRPWLTLASRSSRNPSGGRDVFRFQTFDSEAFWTGALKLPEAVSGADQGGVGPGLGLRNALLLGLKVDAAALPPELIEKLRQGTVDMDDPGVVADLIQSNAIVGVVGGFDDFLVFKGAGKLKAIGTSCALCHSTVDDSVMAGVGRRLDGTPNRDLKMGAIVSLAADLNKLASFQKTDQATLRGTLAGWGPGAVDPRFGANESEAKEIPAIAADHAAWNDLQLISHWNVLLPSLGAAPAGQFASQIAALRAYQEQLAAEAPRRRSAPSHLQD